ncbi:MAG: hypothetical protein H8E45_01280 [Proteobacteria bacterium]|nr:hypothetical protein [Pseudomonadota bacterium]
MSGGGPAGTVVVVVGAKVVCVVEDEVDVEVVVAAATVVVVVPGATVVVVVPLNTPSSQAVPSRAMVVARAATMSLEPIFVFESVIEVFSFLKDVCRSAQNSAQSATQA